MGMEIEVKVAGMNWSKISGSMAKFEPKGTIRMADGQLTFPDEEPAADWKELRIALPAGMVTIDRAKRFIRKDARRIKRVTTSLSFIVDGLVGFNK